jgi:hypothetical protein
MKKKIRQNEPNPMYIHLQKKYNKKLKSQGAPVGNPKTKKRIHKLVITDPLYEKYIKGKSTANERPKGMLTYNAWKKSRPHKRNVQNVQKNFDRKKVIKKAEQIHARKKGPNKSWKASLRQAWKDVYPPKKREYMTKKKTSPKKKTSASKQMDILKRVRETSKQLEEQVKKLERKIS